MNDEDGVPSPAEREPSAGESAVGPAPTADAADAAAAPARQRKRRRQRRTKDSTADPPSMTVMVGPSFRVARTLLGVATLIVVAVLRWWVVALVFAVVGVVAVFWRIRTRKRDPKPPWVRLVATGGGIASLATLGPAITLKMAAMLIHGGEYVPSAETNELPGRFGETMDDLIALLAGFAAATVGLVLIAMGSRKRRR